MPIQPQTKQPDIYWKLLSDTPYASTSPMKPYFYSGRDTKVEHAQMQWLFQGVMIHMTLQAQVSVNKDHNFDFQCEVPGTGGRLYSPIGYYMHEDQFDAYTARQTTIAAADDPFCINLDLQQLVSDCIGWELTRDQAMMLMHLELVHDNYTIETMFEQFDHVATHFALFSPNKMCELPTFDDTQIKLIH